MICDVNPMHIDIVPTLVPIANEVGIEVMGEPVIEPKIERIPENNNNTNRSRCSNILDWAYICFLILLILGILGGFVILMVWLNDPRLFGSQTY